jgi:hypothetical protein
MIVKILSRGKSFKGLATYLTHDPNEKSAERVSWAHTLNLANDHVPSAVDEMLWTARNAELLKQEAGIRAGGRATENAVKHLSLNWAPDETPTREHMIETAQGFLRAMSWQEHQALLVAHDDKEHSHVHVMLNVVHPETGLRLNDDFERRRAQAWALDYEREQGRIYCEQRLQNVEEREDAPTRPAWMAFKENQRKFENEEKALREQAMDFSENAENPRNKNSAEWNRLKEIQRAERQTFFADGKSEFSELRLSIYRETREEFRERWGDFYAAQKDGADSETLAKMKAELVAEQKTTLEARRDEACQELREARNGHYRELLDDQREARLGLRWRQEAGLDNAHFLQQVEDRNTDKDIAVAPTFREAANEVAAREKEDAWNAEDYAFTGSPRDNRSGMKSGADISANVVGGVGISLLSFIGGIADGMVDATPERKPRRAEPEAPRPNMFDTAFEEARQRQQQEREEADREWSRKQRSYGE